MENSNISSAAPRKDFRPRINHREARKAPTHFLAIRIVSDDVFKSALGLQARLLDFDRSLEPDLIRTPKMHITLCVMTLDTNDLLLEAKKRLAGAVSILQKHYPSNGPLLNFTSVNHFRNRILYLEPAADLEKTRLTEFVRELTAHFQGLAIVEPRPWTPHVTLYKPRGRGGAVSNDALAALQHSVCGLHEFMHVDLLSMRGKGVAGYYPCLGSLPFAAHPPATYLVSAATANSVAGGAAEEADEDDVDE